MQRAVGCIVGFVVGVFLAIVLTAFLGTVGDEQGAFFGVFVLGPVVVIVSTVLGGFVAAQPADDPRSQPVEVHQLPPSLGFQRPVRSEGRFIVLAGNDVRDDLVLELARMVDDDTLAKRLEEAYGREVKVLALDTSERETILGALDDPPPGLEELRGVLLSEHEWRSRHGLV
jgi:hypothetical protein